MKIRAADQGDVDSLVALFGHWGHPQPREQVSAILALWSSGQHCRILVADDSGRLAGMAAVSASPRLADPSRDATLAGLVVAPDYRRQGVAARLLDAAEELARSWNCRRIELTSNRARGAAHQFYPARGYAETSASHARYVRPLTGNAPSGDGATARSGTSRAP